MDFIPLGIRKTCVANAGQDCLKISCNLQYYDQPYCSLKYLWTLSVETSHWEFSLKFGMFEVDQYISWITLYRPHFYLW